jgi:WD40 repeat protein
MESSEIKVFDTKSLNMEKYENEVNDVVQPMRTYYDVAAVFKINGEKQIVTTSYDGTIYIVDLKTKKYVNEFHFRAPLEEAKKRIQGFDEHNLYRFEFLRDEKTYKLTRLNIVEEQTGNLGNALFDSRSKFGNISFVTQK